MNKLRIACLLAFSLAPLTANAQSFPCSRARTADEVAICANSGLSALDIRLAGTYRRVLGGLSGSARRGLIQDELDWLATRRACGSDAGCIEDSYRQRIRELNSNY